MMTNSIEQIKARWAKWTPDPWTFIHAPDDIVFLLSYIDLLNEQLKRLHEELDTPEHD